MTNDRLKNMSTSETTRLRRFREQAYKRQGGLCYWCDEPMGPVGSGPRGVTAEHLTQRAVGGATNTTNIVAACAECNQKRERGPRHKSPFAAYKAPRQR
jgi:5-methylcytosine-specific restriction endonuclease McrA